MNESEKTAETTIEKETETVDKKNTIVKICETIDVKSLLNLGDNQEILNSKKITSSNNDVITVNEDGTVVAKDTGKAILTVETPDGNEQQIEVEVVKEDKKTFTSDAEEGQTSGLILPKYVK